MRTRFLPDFLNSASSQHLEALDFLRFPPPQLPPSDPLNFSDLCCFDQFSSHSIAPGIEKLSVDDALNKFLYDVLPQRISVEIDKQLADGLSSEIAHDVLCDGNDEKDVEDQLDICYKSGDANFPEEKVNDGTNAAASTNFSVVQFETPQLHVSMEDTRFLHEERMQVFFEFADTEVSLDPLNFSLGVQHLVEIQKSIFSVDYINLEDQEEQRSDILEDGGSVPSHILSKLRTFPLMEVDETSLGINSYTSEENEHIIFESFAPQPCTQKYELIGDPKELLPSKEFDIMEHVLNQCLVPCLKVEVMCASFVPEMDIINVIEHPTADGKQEFHSGLKDAYSTSTPSPLAFEQFQFLHLNRSHFSEVFFDIEAVSIVEFCEEMFGRTSMLSTFDDLIVTHELTLGDDSFNSLPVPILSDHEMILSVQAIFEEILAELKLLPTSTSDGIYLDWHLFEEDICSHSICNSLKMFEEVDAYCINADLNTCDSGNLVLEFVLSDPCPSVLNMEESIVVLNIQTNAPSSEMTVDPVCHNEVASSKLWNDTCLTRVDGEAIHGIKAKKDGQFVDPMSHFNDIDFLLNPLVATNGKRQNPADLKCEMADNLPVVSSKASIDCTQGASVKQCQNMDSELPRRGSPSISLPNDCSTSLPNEITKNLEPSVPVKEKSMECLEATWNLPIPQVPSATESAKISTSSPSFSDAIIIVNTQNVDTEMIISRRITYQRILAMEKGGVQVVERDLNLPVDVIVSAALCLVWYDSTNIRRKTNASDNADASSFLLSCVENIAANILTSLSFAFSSCILIFEGEVGFLAGIMELSDQIYAAAASLGIDLQLFCSYSSEMTDEIILNCILHAAQLTRGLYPKMPESETLAESFLTKFPSVNPLSAHAILSSVGTLIEFFQMSHQQRVCAVQKYLVPGVSVTLFSALCRYGELEDSRSGMTECSSSVSSGRESGNFCPKSDHEKKKRKYVGNPEKAGMPMDYLLQLQQPNDFIWTPTETVNSGGYWKLEGKEKPDDIRKSGTAFDGILFGENKGCDPIMMLNPRLDKRCGLQISQVPQVSDENKLPDFPVTETSFGQSKRAHVRIQDNLDHRTYYNSRNLQEGSIGEVIDIDDDDDAMTAKDFSFAHSVGFSPVVSSGKCSLRSFPTAAEISSGLDSWTPIKDNGKSSREGINSYPHTDFVNNRTPLEHQQMFLEEPMMGNSATNFCKPSSEEKDTHYGRTPLSKAISSAQLQRGSPWTIEFLNRIKEKSRLRQQSLSAPCFGYSGNSAQFRKRKSPSILDYYRYKRSSTPMQSMEDRRQKIPVQPSSSSKAVKTSPSLLRSQTPIDKRAKRRLTFATNGSKGQSKLIWSDKTDPTLNRRS